MEFTALLTSLKLTNWHTLDRIQVQLWLFCSPELWCGKVKCHPPIYYSSQFKLSSSSSAWKYFILDFGGFEHDLLAFKRLIFVIIDLPLIDLVAIELNIEYMYYLYFILLLFYTFVVYPTCLLVETETLRLVIFNRTKSLLSSSQTIISLYNSRPPLCIFLTISLFFT